MTAHTCRTLTEGCYRCELGRDEMASIDREVVLEFPHLADCDWSLGLDDECSCGLDDALLAMFRAGQAADGDRGGVVALGEVLAGALGEAEREAMDRFDRAHGYPTETDDGLVMKCHCEATPPSHLLGQQVDEALWLWRHHQAEQYATVARIRDAAVEAAVAAERAEVLALASKFEADPHQSSVMTPGQVAQILRDFARGLS